MSLFVINRYLGDEVDSTEDRAKALLEKLRQQAKDRQSQLKCKEQKVKEVSKSFSEEVVEDTVEINNHSEEKKKKTKKRKKTLSDETPTEVEKPSLDAEPEEREELKAKKQRKKKINKEQQEKSISIEAQDEQEEPSKKVHKKEATISASSESVQSEDAKAPRKKKHKQGDEDFSKESGDSTNGYTKVPLKKNNNAEVEEKSAPTGEAKVQQKSQRKHNSSTEPNFLLLGGFEAKPVQKVLPVLPQWLAKPNLVQKDIKHNLVSVHDIPGLDPYIKKKLEANKVKTFFPVQADVIPAILDSCVHGFLVGRGGYRPNDVCVSAPTGSGKTLAFVVPIVQVLTKRVVCEVRALVVLPTKELAQQVCKVFNVYAAGTGLKVVLIAGHKSFAKEQETLVTKKIFGFCSLADILVCTPGRLVDHIQKTEGFTLRHLRFLVIDEADRMIDTMSQDWLPQVISAAYKLEPRDHGSVFARKMPGVPTAANYGQLQLPLQKLLFSATLTHNPEKLQKLGLYQPRLFTSIYKQPKSNTTDDQTRPATSENFSLPQGLTHYYIPCNLNSKPLILLHFLLTLRFSRVLCFTNSKESSHRLFLLIKLFGGISVAEFSSRLSPGERKKTLKEFEQGKLQLLISTDATARGIDLTGVKCVINYDAPQYIRVYVHRVGRTARGGTTGLAFTMLLRIQEQRYLNMMREAGVPKLQKQLVMSESLRQFEQRYEEVLSQLQRVVKQERAEKRC
ncbi:ATP-dependent RNA helicase DDX51 [Bufo gargarizans]|uniref:ATP-dependent RNA helicase DDX51 n=1 Tax=Bufo gargarizans TaxID=30331 RepID=UPI001CF1EF21|nr:ATP-dependent RNA helicase DDX51 [Bufo gargarizans]